MNSMTNLHHLWLKIQELVCLGILWAKYLHPSSPLLYVSWKLELQRLGFVWIKWLNLTFFVDFHSLILPPFGNLSPNAQNSKLSERQKNNIIFSSTQQKKNVHTQYVGESWKLAEVQFLPKYEAWSKNEAANQMRDENIELIQKHDKLERSLPQKWKSIKEKSFLFVERCSNTCWKWEEVNTSRMQQSWCRRFTVLLYGNKIWKCAGFIWKL